MVRFLKLSCRVAHDTDVCCTSPDADSFCCALQRVTLASLALTVSRLVTTVKMVTVTQRQGSVAEAVNRASQAPSATSVSVFEIVSSCSVSFTV